jgi:hypothetical protein
MVAERSRLFATYRSARRPVLLKAESSKKEAAGTPLGTALAGWQGQFSPGYDSSLVEFNESMIHVRYNDFASSNTTG